MNDSKSNPLPEIVDSWSVRMANACINRSPALENSWQYESGIVLKGIEQVWLDTGDEKYLEYIKYNIELFVKPNGDIHTYNLKDYNLTQINTGKLLFLLCQETGDERYQQSLHLLMKQLKTQPRTSEGGFWHKKNLPYQMWLDGIYMAVPFYVQYIDFFKEPTGFDDAIHQILLIERHTHDPKTGLYFHAWDESKIQKWANPRTGCSSLLQGRAIGWYAMAIIDVLDFLPTSHRARERIVTIFVRMIQALLLVQDQNTGLWHQILDQGDYEGNHAEASTSCMFVYALAKGIRKGYLTSNYLEAAQKGYAGIIKYLVETDDYGHVDLMMSYQVEGFSKKQKRVSSREYYIGKSSQINDLNGVGAFLLAGVEMERICKLV